jgi:hypothetical protein
VVRRFGAAASAASEGAATVSAAASPLAAEADAFVRERVVVAFRVVVRFAAVGAGTADESASPVTASLAAVLRRVRRVAGLASSVTMAPFVPPSAVAVEASAPVRRLRVDVRRADPDGPDVAGTDSGVASWAS